MLRDPREDQTSPVDADASTDAATHPLDRTPLNGGAAESRSGGTEQDTWLCGALEALPRAICLLPDLERRLVVGSFYEERPVDELARELRLTPAHAAALLGDAIRTLRVQMSG